MLQANPDDGRGGRRRSRLRDPRLVLMWLRVVLTAGAVFVILAMPASASGPGWSITPSPNPQAQNGFLNWVSCSGASACTAVGSYVRGSSVGATLAERWDGNTWTVERTPNAAGASVSDLQGVSCASSSICTAVGYSIDGSGVQVTLAERWDGTDWTIQPTPNPAGATSIQLISVSCASASACIAVGSSSSGTLAERWDGTNWTIQSTPNPAQGGGVLFGVSCASASACTAVGASNSGSLAARWGGASWNIESTPTPAGAQSVFLNSVACVSPTRCQAVGGFQDRSGVFEALAEQSNGDAWRIEAASNPPGAQGAVLSGVACSTSTACTAIGGYADSSGAFVTLAEGWNGHVWQVQSTPNPSWAQENVLFGVACPSSSRCTAVGQANGAGTPEAMAESWNGAAWSLQPIPSPVGSAETQLNGVSCTSSVSCIAVGYTGPTMGVTSTVAERWDGTTWHLQPIPTTAGAILNAVSCASHSACIAVGTAVDSSGNSVGTMTERWDGTSWSIQPTPTSGSPGSFLNAISCTSPSACTAVGNNSAGQVMAERWDGTSWSGQPVPAPPGAPISFLTGISCASGTACTAVGAVLDSTGNNSLGTVAEQWNGKTWVLQSSPSSHTAGYFLGAVSCTSASACTAVGNTDSGLLAQAWDGTTWTVQSAVTPAGTEGNGDSFSGVSCSTASACTAVGLVFGPGGFPPSTVAERWDGTAWRVQPTPLLPGVHDINGPAVSCPNSLACTAVSGYEDDGPGSVTLAEQWNAGNDGIQSAAPKAVGTGTLGLPLCPITASRRIPSHGCFRANRAAAPTLGVGTLISSGPDRVSLDRMLRSCRGV